MKKPDKNNSAWAILPAAGQGKRFAGSKASIDKLMISLADQPVLIQSLAAVLKTDEIEGAVVVAHPDNIPAYQQAITDWQQQQAETKKPVRVVAGGADRRASVRHGLATLPETCRIVVVHDAARPLIRPSLIRQGIRRLVSAGPKKLTGVVVAIPIVDTLKQISVSQIRVLQEAQPLQINQTIDRSQLWSAQTPQIFWKQPLVQAHDQISTDCVITDDAQLIELAQRGPLEILPGENRNLKITTAEDLSLALWYMTQNQ